MSVASADERDPAAEFVMGLSLFASRTCMFFRVPDLTASRPTARPRAVGEDGWEMVPVRPRCWSYAMKRLETMDRMIDRELAPVVFIAGFKRSRWAFFGV
jgi:hypothetical protein